MMMRLLFDMCIHLRAGGPISVAITHMIPDHAHDTGRLGASRASHPNVSPHIGRGRDGLLLYFELLITTVEPKQLREEKRSNPHLAKRSAALSPREFSQKRAALDGNNRATAFNSHDVQQYLAQLRST